MATANITQVSLSGDNKIDSLISGNRWAASSISYSFPAGGSTFLTQYSSSNEPWNGFMGLSSLQKSAARNALTAWSNVANISFYEVSEPTSSGVIRIAQSNAPETAYAYYPYTDEPGGDVWFGTSSDNYSDPQWQTYSNYAYDTFLHELGHALGLKHPGNYSSDDDPPFASANIDALQYSVMSYISYPYGSSSGGYSNGYSSYPQTPMINDIAAMQYIYGANYNYNAGNTTYTFNPNDSKIFKTIWDGGGTDTFDCSQYTTAVVLQLTPGEWSTFASSQVADLGNGHSAPGNVQNSYLYNNNTSSLIENAIGGSGNDTLRGNQANNTLSGGSGEDQLWGGTGGADTLTGGQGSDAYWWGKGNGSDQVTSSADNAQDALFLYNVYSNQYSAWNANGDLHFSLSDGSALDCKSWYNTAATGRVQSFVYADNIAYAWNNGSGSTVNLYSSIYENNNVRRIQSLDSGNCTLRGGSGSDTIEGNLGEDQLWGGTGGSDTLIGGQGSDVYWWGKGNGSDQITSSSNNAQDALFLYNVYRNQYNAWNANGDLHFSLSDGSTLDCKNWYNNAATARVQSFVYADNIACAWNNGSGATVNLYSSIYETNNIRRVQSLDSGNCTLRGGSGSDTIEGNSGEDHLWGGTGGDDLLSGSSGSDTYWFSSGDSHDTVLSASNNSQDIVRLYGNVARSNLQMSFSGNDLNLSYGSDQLTLKDWNLGGGYCLNQFFFESENNTFSLTVSSGTFSWV